MQIAVFSDVHGNLSALQAVLADIVRRPNLDEVVFAGDACFFGPRPQACVDLLMAYELHSLAGNTDEWIHHPPPFGENLPPPVLERRRHLQDVSAWTAAHLNEQALDWIDALRRRFEYRLSPTGDPADDLLIVHANPRDLMGFIFPPEERQRALYGHVRQADNDLDELLAGVSFGALAYGHVHIPSARLWRGRPLVNVSSVSMPGDGDARSKYAILRWAKDEGWSVEHIFLPYPIKDEIEAFRRYQPPNWENAMAGLERDGYVAQRV